MQRLVYLALAAFFACGGCADPATDTHEGIAVGNPGVMALTLADSEDFTVTEAALPVAWVGFASCEGADRIATLGGTQDFVAGPLLVEAPAGSWCGVVVRFSGEAAFAATWDDGVSTGTLGGALTQVELGFQPIDGPLVVDEDTALVLELGSPGWLDAAALGLEDGEDVVLDAEAPEHAVLVAALADESAVFDDPDGSGELDPPERNAGAVALPAQIQFNEGVVSGLTGDSSSSGCSCESAPSPGGWAAWLLLLLALGVRRTRRSASEQAPLLG